ncbi:MAG: DNA-directed RNA polymerase subunit alpha, partial [Planctomycetota bacterium]
MRIRWRNFELPNRVTVEEATRSDTFGCFYAEPFERGFGTTVGNGLRRILLGSLEGTAVTHVKIGGVQHEFTAMDGVVEDVTEVILNLKRLLVRLTTESLATLRLKRKGKGEVTAAEFEVPHYAEVVNPDLVILNQAKDRKLDLEVTVRAGRGYRTAEENANEEDEIGVIPVDSIFSPVQRVRYRTENTRVGKMTNYDRLILELWTDGTVTPESALVESSKIFRKHLNPFIQYFEIGAELPETERKGEEELAAERELEELRQKLELPISELDLSVRAANC